MTETREHHELHAGCAAFKRDCPMSDRIAAIEREARERRERVDPDLRAPDGTSEFVAFAVEYLALTLGEDNPTIKAGRRIIEALAATEAPRDPEHEARAQRLLDDERRELARLGIAATPDHTEVGEERCACGHLNATCDLPPRATPRPR